MGEWKKLQKIAVRRSHERSCPESEVGGWVRFNVAMSLCQKQCTQLGLVNRLRLIPSSSSSSTHLSIILCAGTILNFELECTKYNSVPFKETSILDRRLFYITSRFLYIYPLFEYTGFPHISLFLGAICQYATAIYVDAIRQPIDVVIVVGAVVVPLCRVNSRPHMQMTYASCAYVRACLRFCASRCRALLVFASISYMRTVAVPTPLNGSNMLTG